MRPDEAHTVRRLPWNAATTSDILAAGRARHHVHALVEVDVTEARARLRATGDRTGEKPSFTGWLACCVGRALAEHPALNCHRLGARRVVQFEAVDAMILVEREAAGERRGLPLVVRGVDRKSVLEVHREVRAAQQGGIGAGDMVAGPRGAGHWLARVPFAADLYPLVPAWVRGLLWRYLAADGFAARRVLGTVGITSVGMFSRIPGWPVSVGLHTVELAVGSVSRKPWVVGDRIEVREILALTVLVDHDLVDGAPAARFVSRLGELLEQAWGLENDGG